MFENMSEWVPTVNPWTAMIAASWFSWLVVRVYRGRI